MINKKRLKKLDFRITITAIYIGGFALLGIIMQDIYTEKKPWLLVYIFMANLILLGIWKGILLTLRNN